MAEVFARPLLATEHTDYDAGAESLAWAIARRCGLSLRIVLPLASNPEYEALAPQVAARAEADATQRLQHLREVAQAEGVAAETTLRRGPETWLDIVEEARQCAADLIVIRRRGRRGVLAGLLLGDMVRNVISHAPCSVLVVPRGAAMWSRRVLVAVDPQAPDLAIVRLAASVAAGCEQPLWVICTTEAASSAQLQRADRVLQAALAEARARGARAEGGVRLGAPPRQIVDAAGELGADLLVLGRHGNEGLARAWVGGVAQKVIGLAQCPVLVIASADPSSRSAP